MADISFDSVAIEQANKLARSEMFMYRQVREKTFRDNFKNVLLVPAEPYLIGSPMTEEEMSLNEAEEFARKHVHEIAREIIAWQDTAVLQQGRLRELAAICTGITTTHALRLAESLVVREALMIVASQRRHEAS